MTHIGRAVYTARPAGITEISVHVTGAITVNGYPHTPEELTAVSNVIDRALKLAAHYRLINAGAEPH